MISSLEALTSERVAIEGKAGGYTRDDEDHAEHHAGLSLECARQRKLALQGAASDRQGKTESSAERIKIRYEADGEKIKIL